MADDSTVDLADSTVDLNAVADHNRDPMPQQRTYTFPCKPSNSGGLAHTLSVTLSRDVVATAGRITVHFDVQHDPSTEQNPTPNSLGVMRFSVQEEFPPGSRPSSSLNQAGSEIRYTQAYLDAIEYETNPRNLEALWKPVYRIVLVDLIDMMDTCYVREEWPISVFDDSRDKMPLTKTVSMPRGGGKTVIPDLTLLMQLGTITSNHRLLHKRFRPILVELKRAISRSLTVHGYPDPDKPQAVDQLLASFGVAQEQVELAGCLQMLQAPEQPHILLVAAVGAWFRVIFLSRKAILESPHAKLSEAEIEHTVNEVLEGRDEALRNDVPESPNPAEKGWTDLVHLDPKFADRKYELKELSSFTHWTPPMMLGTAPANLIWDKIRGLLHKMLCEGHM